MRMQKGIGGGGVKDRANGQTKREYGKGKWIFMIIKRKGGRSWGEEPEKIGPAGEGGERE